MGKFVLISGICLLAISVQAATYKDKQLHRAVRSPYYGAHFHDTPPYPPPPPPPPPPPFIYRTHNWSGVGRGNEGAVEGVFSGAAATAESSIPASNTAFSLAASAAGASVPVQFEEQSAESFGNSGNGGYKKYNQYGSKSSQYGSQEHGSGSADYSEKSGNSGGYSGINSYKTREESSSFSSQLNQNIAADGHGQESNRNYGQTASFSSGGAGNSGSYDSGHEKNFKESRYSVQNGEGSQQRDVGGNQRNFDGEGQSYSGGYSKSQSQSSSSGAQFATAQGSAQSGSKGYGHGNNNEHSADRGYENQSGKSESFNSQQLQSTAGLQQSAGYEGSNGGAGYSEHQSALHGALELASQGLQAAKNSECSSCQKSTYALSNAKSHSGSAIALSIGG